MIKYEDEDEKKEENKDDDPQENLIDFMWQSMTEQK